ncbi:GtrA family protein [Micropruina sp.]|uniref:GtrA family protein n=1 Tax=Micropruina sp. TaxID=2737536 RepID=UPI0026261A21|nr:GtrA family protein [Micropruina sp.]
MTEATTTQLGLRPQLFRFVLTGGLSAIVDYGLLVVLMAFGLDHTPAKVLSFIAGTTTAYLINRRWTFNSDGSRRKFAAVMALYALTFVLQVGIFTPLYPWLVSLGLGAEFMPKMNWAQLFGFVVAQGVATAVNFVVQRSVIFKA